MKLFVTAMLVVCAVLSTPLRAQEHSVVVELFTSQGCASCPPADAILHRLAARDDVIALALHVDYWDYIGWKDEYALATNARRQRGYADVGGRDMIYTPQMIINGVDDVVGAHAMDVAEIIERQKARKPEIALSATRRGSQLSIRAERLGQSPAGSMSVQLVRFSPLRTVRITRGENAGHELDYANVVDAWSVLGEWDGRAPLHLETELTGDLPAVVLLQYSGPGEIVAAAATD
ncbi:DUF1223 domain-containing protein [Microbulbifer sp. S227A]|uniref:DUF1223 domain-containing protein n=1 Tax=Microbulbifer sp. S227A TaxID=3415131 RepID=UPI003C79E08B